jgi:hypothetical protein
MAPSRPTRAAQVNFDPKFRRPKAALAGARERRLARRLIPASVSG